MVLSEAGRFRAVRTFDSRIDLLRSAKPLKNRAPVHFHAGTAEVEAEVRWLDGRTRLEPGESAWARVVLREPTLLLPGDRFIIRMFSPVVTIGGGVVTDISGRRYKKGEDAGLRLAALTPEALILEAPFGMEEVQLIGLTGIQSAPKSAGIERAGKWLIGRTRVAEFREQLTGACRAFHQSNSLLPGMQKQDLKSAVMRKASPELFEHALAGAAELVQQGEVVRLRSHKIVLRQDEEQTRTAIETAFERAGLAAPAVPEVLKSCGVEAARARAILEILLREKRLVRVSPDLVLHASVLARLRKMLEAKRGTRFGVGAFKDWTGVSRKYAIPLLEYLDRDHVTRREGEERLIL
jgi:selenocysteine-specific elongation factor